MEALVGLTWQALLKAIEFWFTENLVSGSYIRREASFRSQGSATIRGLSGEISLRVK